ncbi:MAG: hypothetical protein H6897_13210 [Rhodobacteraceae bacterium]|nr:hypothetical protein [Paracoccaceae bacterium]MCC0070873.1 hypothetical protein [Paracoccaceae bacterium]
MDERQTERVGEVLLPERKRDRACCGRARGFQMLEDAHERPADLLNHIALAERGDRLSPELLLDGGDLHLVAGAWTVDLPPFTSRLMSALLPGPGIQGTHAPRGR